MTTSPFLLHRAIRMAKKAHRGQKDKGSMPYWRHLAFVAGRVEGRDAKIVAWLHDTVEDQPDKVSFDRLRAAGFPERIVAAVDAMTKREPRDGDDYMGYIARVKRDPIAREVKKADIVHNLMIDRIKEFKPEDRERLKKYVDAYYELTH